jgi:hypothetical protein
MGRLESAPVLSAPCLLLKLAGLLLAMVFCQPIELILPVKTGRAGRKP